MGLITRQGLPPALSLPMPRESGGDAVWAAGSGLPTLAVGPALPWAD
jgi:hypothetical protein